MQSYVAGGKALLRFACSVAGDEVTMRVCLRSSLMKLYWPETRRGTGMWPAEPLEGDQVSHEINPRISANLGLAMVKCAP